MQGTRGTSYENLSIGLMVIAVAVALILAWIIGNWWMFIPIMLISGGMIWAILGLIMAPVDTQLRQGRQSVPYFVFWGATLALLGAIWIVNDEFPGNGVVLVAIFLVWIGAIVIALSFRRGKGA
jgi:hypothetical protein